MAICKTLRLRDLEPELLRFMRNERAALQRALVTTAEVDAPRWIQWCIRGGGWGGSSQTPAPPPKPPAPPRKPPSLSKRLRKAVRRALKRNTPKTRRPARARKQRQPPPQQPPQGYRMPIDTGDYANSWRVDVRQDEAFIYSAASPAVKAGVIEYGRRPGPIPIAPLAQWVLRKLDVSDTLGVSDQAAAEVIAKAISDKARHQRRPGLHVLGRAHPRIAAALAQHVRRELKTSQR